MKQQKWKLGFLAGLAVLGLTAAEPSIYISFDRGVRADFGGSGDGSTVAGLRDASGVPATLSVKNAGDKKINADDLLEEGLSGKAFPLGQLKDGTINTLQYVPSPALRSDRGSVSMWIKPVDWDGIENGVFRHFFSAKSRKFGPDWLFVYKHNSTNNIFFYYGLNEGKDNKFSQAISPVKTWKKGEWHHLGATWSKDALVFYIDGKQTAISQMNHLMKGPFEFFLLGEHWSGNPGKTLLDEVRIFDAVLSGDDMQKEYERLSSKAGKRKEAPVLISSAKKTPVLDGMISENEYPAVIGTMMDYTGRKNNFAVVQSTTRFAWDDQYIYCAVTSSGENMKSDQKGRDAHVYMDDSVEFHIKTDKNQYQFIFNAVDSLFDMRNSDISWNSEGVRMASKIAGNKWILEVAIPWKTLNVTAADGQKYLINVVRNYTNPALSTQIAPTKASFHESEYYAELKLWADAPAYDISAMGELYNMSLNSTFLATPKQNEKVQIRFDADAPLFSVNTNQSFEMTAGKTFKHNVTRKLPENSTLVCQIDIPGKGTLYKTKVDYFSPESVRLWYIYTDLKKQELVFVMKNSILGTGESKVRLDIVTTNGKNTVDSVTLPISDKKPVVEVRYPVTKLAADRYDLRYTLINSRGKEFYKDMEEYEYFKNGAPWDNIQDGLEDVLPTPWTPVAGKNDQFDCWGRTVRFGGKGFISSIVSQKHELLTRPVVLKINGKSAAFKAACTGSRPTMATYRLTPVDPSVPVSFDVVAEFDGFIQFYGKVKPNATVEKMSLEIAIDKKFADGFDDCHSCFYKNSLIGNVSLDVNTVQKPHFWVGSEIAGMMGGTWTKRGWHLQNKAQSMTVKSNEKETVLTIHIADVKYTAGNNGEAFSFFLNPTPVKPLRKWKEIPFERKNMMLAGKRDAKFFFYYVPGYFDRYKDWVIDRFKKDGRTPIEKVNLLASHSSKGVSPLSPAWHYYAEDWVNPPPGLGQYSQDIQDARRRHVRNRYVFTYGCHNSRSFHDFKIYCGKNSLEGTKYGLDDVTDMYFDLAWPKVCGNTHHGCGWTDEFGDTIRDNDLLNLRKYHLRLYRMMQKKTPGSYFSGHVFYSRTPSDNFFDFVVVGEMYDAKIYKKLSYYDVFDPELMRIAYTTRSNEITISLMPQFLRSLECFAPERKGSWDPFTPENDRAVRHFMAYSSVFNLTHTHDIWCAGQKLPPPGKGQVEKWSNAYDQLGRDLVYKRGMKTIPANEKFLTATYTGNGKVLAVILNDTDQHQTFKVAMETGNRTGVELFTKKQYKAVDGYIEVSLPGRESAMIFFE